MQTLINNGLGAIQMSRLDQNLGDELINTSKNTSDLVRLSSAQHKQIRRTGPPTICSIIGTQDMKGTLIRESLGSPPFALLKGPGFHISTIVRIHPLP